MVAYTLLDNGILRYPGRIRFGGEWESTIRATPFTPVPGIPLLDQVVEASRNAPYSTGGGGSLLRQVRRNHDGLLGGFVAGPQCLSQEGTCFVHDSAQVWPTGRVSGNAQVHGEAVIKGVVGGDVVVLAGSVEGRVGGRLQVNTYVPEWAWWQDVAHPWGSPMTTAYSLFTRDFGRPPTKERLEYWTARVRAWLEDNGVAPDAPEDQLARAAGPIAAAMRVTLEDQVDRMFPDLSMDERARRMDFFRAAMGHPVFETGRGLEDPRNWMVFGLERLTAYLDPEPGTLGGVMAQTTRGVFMEVRGREPTPPEVAAVVVFWRDVKGSLPRGFPALLRAALGAGPVRPPNQETPPPPPLPPPEQRVPDSDDPAALLATLVFNMASNAHAQGLWNNPQVQALVNGARNAIGREPSLQGIVQGLDALAQAGPPSTRRPHSPAVDEVVYAAMPAPTSPQELLANLRALQGC